MLHEADDLSEVMVAQELHRAAMLEPEKGFPPAGGRSGAQPYPGRGTHYCFVSDAEIFPQFGCGAPGHGGHAAEHLGGVET